MADSELNPQHPVTVNLHGHWHKIAAFIMVKLQVKEVTLDLADLEYQPPEGINIVAQEIGDALKISLVDNKTAHLLAHS